MGDVCGDVVVCGGRVWGSGRLWGDLVVCGRRGRLGGPWSSVGDLEHKSGKDSMSGLAIESAKQPSSSSAFPISGSTLSQTTTQKHYQLRRKFLILDLKIKDKITII